MSDAKPTAKVAAAAAKPEKFVVPPSWKERCELLRLSAEARSSFFPLHVDFIKSLLIAESIDFVLYIAVGWDMYEFIRPKDFKIELVKELINTHKDYPSQTRICIKKTDLGRYEKLVTHYLREKFVAASSGNAMAHEGAFRIYAGLSDGSQLVVRAAMDEECFNRISKACSYAVTHMCSTRDALNFLVQIVGKEPALYDHGAVTSMVATVIAWNTMKLHQRESKLTAQAGILHDLERHCSYLGKPADRTQISLQGIKELTTMKEKGVGFHESTIEAMQQYREHFDGTGIPKKLRGAAEGVDSLNGIARISRIVSIGCAFSEYMLKRQEKQPLPLATIFKLLKERTDKGEFDPQMMAQFIADADTATMRKASEEKSQEDSDSDYED